MLSKQPMGGIAVLMTALANQYELQHGLELRWPSSYVDGFTASEFGPYLSRMLEVVQSLAGTKQEAADSRPTSAAAPMPRRKRARRKPSTGAP
jgi:hypothetical protein